MLGAKTAVGRTLALAGSAAAFALAGCAALPRARPAAPVSPAASATFAAAVELWRDADPASGPAASAAARAALEIEPGWVAPRRFLDDRALADLLGPERLAAHRARLELVPDDAAAWYLAGRLEGEEGQRRFRKAVELDPSLSWAWHGLAWSAFGRGATRQALWLGARALAVARDPYERARFAWALAQYHRARDDPRRAARVLQDMLESPDLSARSRAWLGAELAVLELRSDDDALRERGMRRALARLADPHTAEAEVIELVAAVGRLRHLDAGGLELALSSIESPARRRLLGELLADTPLGYRLLESITRVEGETESAHPEIAALAPLWRRAAEFRHGSPSRAIEDWRSSLPRAVLDGRGLPRDPRLARIVTAARELPDVPLTDLRSDDLVELAEALLAAGWFREARSLASRVPGGDLERALELETLALAGESAVAGVTRLVQRLDRGDARISPLVSATPEEPSPGGSPRARRGRERPVEDLNDLLVAMAPSFARANRWLGGETDPRVLARELVDSPRVGFGWIGGIVHPGPSFSAEDERLGRGPRGEPVPGLAAELARLGRFGVFGEHVGDGAPDGTLLRRLLVERRSGEHLGTPWSGTVVWCEGVDLPGRAGRQGATIGGAALHEGYWIDVEVVRADLERWRVLARRFVGTGSEAPVRRALSVDGLAAKPDERASIDHLLGQAERVRLAVLADRAGDGEVLGALSLDELLEVTSVHEQGHLCDRARFYPIGEHLLRSLAFLARAGFSGTAVARRLEYRAQLVTLCVATDPRIALVDVLSAAEHGGDATPHAAAYRSLLADLVEELDLALERDPSAWPELDPGRTLVHQTHRLRPEALRRVALSLARRRGLVAAPPETPEAREASEAPADPEATSKSGEPSGGSARPTSA